jgi:hypothetical protein
MSDPLDLDELRAAANTEIELTHHVGRPYRSARIWIHAEDALTLLDRLQQAEAERDEVKRHLNATLRRETGALAERDAAKELAVEFMTERDAARARIDRVRDVVARFEVGGPVAECGPDCPGCIVDQVRRALDGDA